MSNTDALRAAAQQALECLEQLQGGCTDSGDGTVEAITVWCPEIVEALRAALAEQPAASGEPVAFDAEGFRAFVLRELPDGTIIGKSEWWADHLTKCAQWFVKPAAPQPAPARVPLAWHCPRDPDSATAFFWRRPKNGLCPNCVNQLVPVVLAAAPTAPPVKQSLTTAGAPDAPSESNTQR